MAKVFNGGDFLKAKAVTIVLSNGFTKDISELPDDALDEVSKVIDDTEGDPQAGSVNEPRKVLSRLLSCTVEDLKGVGPVEIKGVMDFLTKSLFE